MSTHLDGSFDYVFTYCGCFPSSIVNYMNCINPNWCLASKILIVLWTSTFRINVNGSITLFLKTATYKANVKKFQICETLLLVFPNVFVDHILPCLFENFSCFGIYTKKIKHGVRLWVRVWNDTHLILLNATIMFTIWKIEN